MNAETQYRLNAVDMETVLALVRTGTLAEAGGRLGVDGSTVFRNLQRLEKGLGLALFARSRSGYQPTDLALDIAQRAERIEAELDDARTLLQRGRSTVSGTVRISTTDTMLHKLVLPILKDFATQHPLLRFEINTGNELANLTRRDTDIAVRATLKPPQHLVGKQVGPIRIALYRSRDYALPDTNADTLAQATWIAPDDALPDHLSVLWRKKQFPKVTPQYTVNSIHSVMEAIALGLGIGAIPLFLAAGRDDLERITQPIAECETQLWLLTHPESRHLTRIATVFRHFSENIRLS